MITTRGEIILNEPVMAERANTAITVTPEELNQGINHTFGRDSEGHFRKGQLLMSESLAAVANGLHERKGKVIFEDELSQDLAGGEENNKDVAEKLTFSKETNPSEGTSIDPESVETKMFLGLEAIKQEIEQTIENVGVAISEGEVEEASNLVKTLVTRMERAGMDSLPKDIQTLYENVKQNLSQAISEKNPVAKLRLYKFACGVMDYIPVAGPAKMLLEAAAGKTLGGESLDGWKRFLHGAEGAVFLTIDLTGFGAIATKLAKASKAGMLAPKLITRSAALMKTLGVAKEVYQPLYKFGRMLVTYPKLGQAATKGLEWMIKERQIQLTKGLPKILVTNEPTVTEQKISEVKNRPGMSWKIGEKIIPATE